MKLLFIGDIVGKPGRDAVRALLGNLIERFRIDCVIANGENAAGGFGITEAMAEELFGHGVHVITSGNHIWDKKEAVSYLATTDRVLRPLNYPPGVPGQGSVVYTLKDGRKIGVLNLSGRVYMANWDCPFRAAKDEVARLREHTNIIFVDFHAEATSEKIAMGYYLDGKVSAVVGTHTHVQTADERVLPGGTAYLTDAGMTGPIESVIGIEKDMIIQRFLTLMPMRFDAAEGPGMLCGAVIDIDDASGKAKSITRLQLTNSKG